MTLALHTRWLKLTAVVIGSFGPVFFNPGPEETVGLDAVKEEGARP
jgi:hypothetical protein